MIGKLDYTVLENAKGLATYDFDAFADEHACNDSYYKRAQDLYPFLQNLVDFSKVDYIVGGNPAVSYMYLLEEVDPLASLPSEFGGVIHGIPIYGVWACEPMDNLILFVMKDTADNFLIRVNNLRKLVFTKTASLVCHAKSQAKLI